MSRFDVKEIMFMYYQNEKKLIKLSTMTTFEKLIAISEITLVRNKFGNLFVYLGLQRSFSNLRVKKIKLKGD